ncbi:hypothetical protein KCP78_19290 [Salmonella enterica subsp. enterica]|nr:hypothetical protein KCP78_19290 [Salmonella enterica subsp. enterica]
MIAGLPGFTSTTRRVFAIRWCNRLMRKGHQLITASAAIIVLCASPDEVADLFYQNWSGCKTYGPSALLTASVLAIYRMFHNASDAGSGMLARAIALHGNSVSTGGRLFDRRGAGDSAARGGFKVYEQQTSWPLVLQNSKTIVLGF